MDGESGELTEWEEVVGAWTGRTETDGLKWGWRRELWSWFQRQATSSITIQTALGGYTEFRKGADQGVLGAIFHRGLLMLNLMHFDPGGCRVARQTGRPVHFPWIHHWWHWPRYNTIQQTPRSPTLPLVRERGHYILQLFFSYFILTGSAFFRRSSNDILKTFPRDQVFGSRPSDHYFRSVCLSVCLFVCLSVCAEFFSAVFDAIWIKLGHMLHVWV